MLVSCAAAPAARPQWLEYGLEAVYPAARYIAEEGRGRTKAAAENAALARIARYFHSDVSSSSRVAESQERTGKNGNYRYTSTTNITNDAFVRSAAKLFAVRYTAPYYNKSEKEYVMAAYINREEAWAIFEPRIQREIDGFRALYRRAESETDAIRAYFDYKAARHYAERDELKSAFSFAETLDGEKMAALSKAARAELAALGAKLNESRAMASVVIESNKDFESSIVSALTRLLSSQGINVTTNKKAAQAVCAVTVDEGDSQKSADAAVFYYPHIRVTLGSKNREPVFSYSASAGKEGALTADVAKRRAYGALVVLLEKEFLTEFNKAFK